MARSSFPPCRLPACLLVLVALVVPGAVVAAESDVHEFELDNGMKILVREDRRAPVVVSQVWYRIGSIDEHRGITGVSHVLEHMMFKGTEEVGPGEFSEIVARHGGEGNAFTGHGFTAYFQQIAAEHLELCLRLEADRMTGLALDEAEFERELRVVQEERRQRVEDNPHSLTRERLQAAAFPSSPVRNPVIGWSTDLQSMRMDDVDRWYRRWYAPNNAALVVVGDVDAERVHALARRHFGDKQSVELPRRAPLREIEPRGEIRLDVRATARLPWLAMGWRVPSLATTDDPADVYALDVLVGILDGGRSARIERDVVRGRGIASAAGASYSLLSRGDELLAISGRPAQGRTVEELESALRDQIEGLKAEPIDDAELERVKTNVRADEVYQRDSMFYQAMRTGMLEMAGVGQDAYAAYRAGVQEVTAEDVRRVARAYLTDERLTVARLVPAGLEPDTPVEEGAPPPAGDGEPKGGDAVAH